jgi:hypothetical protein
MTNFSELGEVLNSNTHSSKIRKNKIHINVIFCTRNAEELSPEAMKRLWNAVEKPCGHKFKMKAWSCVIFLQVYESSLETENTAVGDLSH